MSPLLLLSLHALPTFPYTGVEKVGVQAGAGAVFVETLNGEEMEGSLKGDRRKEQTDGHDQIAYGAEGGICGHARCSSFCFGFHR